MLSYYHAFLLAIATYACHLLFKLFIQFIFDIQYSYINPLNLSVHNIQINTPLSSGCVTVKIDKIKLHLYLLFRSKSYMRISIFGLGIDLQNLDLDSVHSNQAKEKVDLKCQETIGKLKNFEFDPAEPVSIFCDNKKLNRLAKFLIETIPHYSFKIVEAKLLISTDLSINCERIAGKTDIERSIIRTSFLRKHKSPNHAWISSLTLENANIYSISRNQILSQFFGQCETSVKFKLNINTGIIDSLEPRFRLNCIDISILYVLKLIKSLMPSFGLNKPDSSTQSSPIKQNLYPKISQGKLYLYAFVFRLIKNANYSIQSINLTEIPIGDPSKINSFINDDCSSFEGILFASTSIDSITLGLKPISPNQVGYSLKFVEGSYPLQWIFTLSNLKVSLDYSKLSTYQNYQKYFDVLAIPNLLFTMESTMMVNLLRVVFNKYEPSKFIRKQTITIIQLTVANPSIDISVEQLVLLIKTINETRKSISKNKCSVEYTPRPKFYEDIFLNTSPKFHFKILLEKPIFILKSDPQLLKNDNVYLLVLQPSLINFQLDAIANAKSMMEMAFRFDIPETSFIYQMNNLITSSATLACVKDILFKANFQLFEFARVRISLDLSHLSIDLTNLQALNGLGIIFNMLGFFTQKHRAPLQSGRGSSQQKDTLAPLLFKELPDWFQKISFTFSDIKIKLGSKSLFMNADDLFNEINNLNPLLNENTITPSSITYKMHGAEVSIKAKTLETDTDSDSLRTSESKPVDEYFWLVQSNLGLSQITSNIQYPGSDFITKKKIFVIPQIISNFYCLKSKLFEFSNGVDSIVINHDISSHFTLFSSFYLLKNVFSYPKAQFDSLKNKNIQKIDEDENSLNKSKLKVVDKVERTEKLNKFELFKLTWYIKEIQFKFLMPENFNFRIDIFGLKGVASNNDIVLQNRLFRLAIIKDPRYNFFSRLLTFDNMEVICQLPSKPHQLPKISIHDSNIKISIPSNFVVHSLFDAILLTMKLTKKFIHSIKEGPTLALDKITASGIVNLPKLNIKTESLSFVLEDDPFETELGMIYQLGLLEQKLRLEKLKYFQDTINKIKEEATELVDNEAALKDFNRSLDEIYLLSPNITLENNGDPRLQILIDECSRNLHKLRVNISKSWMKIVTEFKIKRRNVVAMNINYLTGTLISSLPVSSTFNSKMVDFNDMPPLMGLHFNDFILSIRPQLFENDSNDVHEFLYRVGKGVPRDTTWDKIIPMRMVIKAAEVRIHLRDFPLPMVYIPNSKSNERWSNSFVLKANLVIAEPMPVSDKEYWYIYIPMFDNIHEGGSLNKYYSWKAPKTICSVKTYYEVDCDIKSDNSTVVTWSTSYQAVLRQLNLNFDTFSKVTKDPSPKLGVWDKLRNILHGYAKFNWANNGSEVRFNILNSSDPYKLLTFSAGFTLVFENEVKWLINDPDREHERDYFIFRSKNIVFGIPNFLSEPLPCWCSRQLLFLPSNRDQVLLTSMYGYYLNIETYYDDSPKMRNLLNITRNYKLKTDNISLKGDLELKLSMVFERKLKNGKRTSEFKSHFQNVLTNPNYVEDKENFDSYEGFRSDIIHMSFGLTAKNSTYNILRISTRTLGQFMTWFKRFSGDPALPIRTGTLWGSRNKSVKLGSHLMTFKFKFDVEQLYIYRGYRFDLANLQNQSSIGFKAKIKSFKCDLHERKERKVKHNEFFNKDLNIMKMTFYIGKVELTDIDLRMIGLSFDKAKDSGAPKHTFEIYDNDDDWIDILDFEEVDLPSLKNADIRGQVLPLLYASNFKYWMNKKLTKNTFGDEDSHDCLIDLQNYPDTSYNHLFEVESLKFKWYCDVRNFLFACLAEAEFRSSYFYSASYKTRRAISKRIGEIDEDSKTKPSDTRPEIVEFSINGKKDFDKIMRSVKEYVNDIVSVDDMLIKFDDVQIQIMIDPEDDYLMLCRIQHNEVEIVSLMDNDWYNFVESANLAKRYGTIFENADVLIISRKEYNALNKINAHYGSTEPWPPFLDGDEPTEFINDKTLLSDVLIFFFFESSSNSYAGSKRRNKLYLNIPKFETKLDSESYLTSLAIIQRVIVYEPSQQKKFAEMVQTVSLSTGSQDQRLLSTQLEKCSFQIHELIALHEALTTLRYIDEDEQEIDKVIRLKLSKLFANSLILSKTLLLAIDPRDAHEKDDACFIEWIIMASNVNVDFVENGDSFLSFNLRNSKFTRMEMLDKSTLNELTIEEFEILNKDYNILFPDLLKAYNVNENKLCQKFETLNKNEMLKIVWDLSEKIGGMRNISDIQIFCHPMQLKLEEKTGIKLMHFLFPNESRYQKGHNKSDNIDSDSDVEYLNESDDDEYTKKDDDIYGDSDESTDGRAEDFEPNANLNGTTNKLLTPLIEISKSDNENGSDHETSYLDYSNTSDETENFNGSGLLKKDEQSVISGTSNVPKAQKSIRSSYSKKLNKIIIHRPMINAVSAVDTLVQMGITANIEIERQSAGMNEMTERASKYFSIKNLEMNDTMLVVTLYGTGLVRLLNVIDLKLMVPKFTVRKKIWTSLELINAIKKHIIKALLKQTGRLVKNKIFVHKYRKRHNKKIVKN